MGYDEVVFKSPVDKHLECPVCLFPLKSPVQTDCGHLFCQACIAPILRHKEPKCPLDKKPLDLSRIFPDNYTNKLLLNMTVLCNHGGDGCGWEGLLKDLEEHLDECLYMPTLCSLKCGMLLPRKDIKEHQKTSCEKRKVICPHCSKKFSNAALTDHVTKDCPMVEVGCKYECGVPKMPRCKMSEHIDPVTGNCSKAQVVCPFFKGGCDHKMPRTDLEAHLKDVEYMGKHFLGFHIATIEASKQDDKEKRLQEAEEKAQRAEALVQIFEADKYQLQQRVVKLEERVDNVQLINANLEKKVADLEIALQMSNCDSRRFEQQNRMPIASSGLKEFYLATDTVKDGCTDSLPDTTTVESISVNPQLLADVESCKQKISDFEKQMRSMDRMTAARDISVAEQDLRIQVLESSFYDGVLLWRIPNFRRRRQDAISGRTTSLYSPPFYSSRRGYKMCGRVYLNGDGMGKGTHLSLFFVVMKGNFDALLPWPFRQRVTLMVLNQSNPQRHTLDTFRPDSQSSSFQRPSQDMNVASGCPLFIPLPALETKGYVKDDVLFVCIKVDTSNIPQL